MTRTKIFPNLFLLLLLFAANGAAFAQGTFSRLTGVVQDQNGAVVPGATVTLTNEATNVAQTAETSDGGVYVFDSINVGTYSVTIEKPGFKKFVGTNNVVNPNQTTTVDARLDTGAVTEIVTVESAAELVQTSSSGNFGSTIEERTLETLPIVGVRGRNPLRFIDYQPGVVTGANAGGGVHVNGSRDRAFNFTLDGIDINETSAGGSNFTPLRVNPDSVQEFQIVTGNFTSELGRSSGAQVSLVTRGGGNDFRGNAFYFYQTPEFQANEYQNTINNVPKRQFVQNIFGGSFGGPIIKNKAFFFTNLQLLRASESILVTRTVLTQQARQGIYRYVVGGLNRPAGVVGASVDQSGNPISGLNVGSYNIGSTTLPICATNPATCGLDPTIQRIIGVTPLPNNFAVGDGLNTAGFNFAAPSRERQYDFTVRGDYNFNDRNTLYVRYAQGRQDTVGDNGNGGLRRFPDLADFVTTFRDPKNLAFNYRFSPNSNITNEFVYGINRFTFSFNNPDENFANNPPIILNIATDPFNNTPTVNNARRLVTNQVVDNLTFIRGAHTFKTGINFRFQQQYDDRQALTAITAGLGTAANPVDVNQFGINTLTGLAAADRTRLQSLVNDLLGRLGNVSRSFVANADGSAYLPAGEGLIFDARYNDLDFYGQDTWKARPNLTFDIGLRAEVRLSPRSEGNPVLRPNRAVRLGEAPGNDLRWEEGKLFDDQVLLAPSVGFAWDPLSDGKNSIRANYRIAYDRISTFLFSSFVFQTQPGLILPVTTQGGLLRNGLPNLAPPVGRTPESLRQPFAFSNSTITVVDPNLKYPENHQWALSYQRDIGAGFVGEVSYIGRRGTHLLGGYDVNQVDIFNNGFLAAFNAVRNGATDVPLLNTLLDSRRTSTETGTAFFRRTFVNEIAQNNVASAAFQVASFLRNAGTAAAEPAFLRRADGTRNELSPFFFQPFPQFINGLNVIDSNDISLYHGLQFILRRRFEQGLSLQFGYTLSRSEDTRSFDPTFAVANRGSAQSASSTPLDLRNRRLNYARSDFDRTHVFQANFVYELPFGKGRRFGGDLPRALDFAIGGWQIGGLVLRQSGRPFTVYSGVNTVSNAVQSPANCDGCSRDFGRLIQEAGTNFWFSAEQRARFSIPEPGTLGNTGRNFFTSPSFSQLDLTLSKQFRFTETRNLEIRFDGQNVMNLPRFDIPVAVIAPINPAFGRIRDSVIGNARRLQLGVKLNF